MKNQVTLIGNLGADLECKTIGNDKKMARGSLVTNQYYKNRDGETVQDTQWHNIVSWGKLASHMEQLSSKGDQVMVQGRLTYRKFEVGDGRQHYLTEIVVQEFMLLSKVKAKVTA